MTQKKKKTRQKKKKTSPKLQNWNLPESELAEILKQISIIIATLGYKYKFGPYECEDLEGEALIKINKEYHRFDPKKGKSDELSKKRYNFMFAVINNHLYNLKRNKFRRFTPPCLKCPINAYVDGKCTAYSDLEECTYYVDWIKVNNQKENLTQVFSVEDTVRSDTIAPLEKLKNAEIILEIHMQLSTRSQQTLVDYLNKEKINKTRWEDFLEECQEVMISGE